MTQPPLQSPCLHMLSIFICYSPPYTNRIPSLSKPSNNIPYTCVTDLWVPLLTNLMNIIFITMSASCITSLNKMPNLLGSFLLQLRKSLDLKKWTILKTSSSSKMGISCYTMPFGCGERWSYLCLEFEAFQGMWLDTYVQDGRLLGKIISVDIWRKLFQLCLNFCNFWHAY